MKATHAIIQSANYACIWSEDPDSDPPPGRRLAQDLHRALIAAGCTSRSAHIGDRDWEHSSWFFSVRWGHHTYEVDVEASPTDTTPPTWRIGIARIRGVLFALFGDRAGRCEVDDRFLRVVADQIQTLTACAPPIWLTEDQAIAALWGSAIRNRRKTMPSESQFIRERCLSVIRKAAMNESHWEMTILDGIHPPIQDRVHLADGEYPLVSFYAGKGDWTLYTTHRLVGEVDGMRTEIARSDFDACDFGDFKQDVDSPRVKAAVISRGKKTSRVLYESSYASIAPIYYFRFWALK